LAYLYAFQGFIFGFAFTFLQSQPGVQNTILFKEGALIGVSLWGLIALVASITLLVGMTLKKTQLVQIGSVGMFMAWIFAGIIYMAGGYNFFLLPIAITNVLMYGYYYLASSLGQLWDYAPDA
jgi:hypothetical protein